MPGGWPRSRPSSPTARRTGFSCHFSNRPTRRRSRRYAAPSPRAIARAVFTASLDVLSNLPWPASAETATRHPFGSRLGLPEYGRRGVTPTVEPAYLTSAGRMPERRQIRVSGGLEGRSERPARRYGVTASRRLTCLPRVSNDRLKPVLRRHHTLTHWWLLALASTASQTFCVSRASRNVGWAGFFLA